MKQSDFVKANEVWNEYGRLQIVAACIQAQGAVGAILSIGGCCFPVTATGQVVTALKAEMRDKTNALAAQLAELGVVLDPLDDASEAPQPAAEQTSDGTGVAAEPDAAGVASLGNPNADPAPSADAPAEPAADEPTAEGDTATGDTAATPAEPAEPAAATVEAAAA